MKVIASANLPFVVVENREFLKFCEMMRGRTYNCPKRAEVSGPLLNKLFQDVEQERHAELAGRNGTLLIDGWSDCKRDPVLGFSFATWEKCHLVELLATDDAHTADNMLPVALRVMEEVKALGAVCATVCTDNARNMERLRRDLRTKQVEEINQLAAACGDAAKLEDLRANLVIDAYGCSLRVLAQGFGSGFKQRLRYYPSSCCLTALSTNSPGNFSSAPSLTSVGTRQANGQETHKGFWFMRTPCCTPCTGMWEMVVPGTLAVAHLLNLVAQDVSDGPILEHVKNVAKYFRNNNGPKAWLQACEPPVPRAPMPGDTRWNGAADLLEWYCKYATPHLVQRSSLLLLRHRFWSQLVSVMQTNRGDREVFRVLQNIGIQTNAEDLLQVVGKFCLFSFSDTCASTGDKGGGSDPGRNAAG